MSKKVRAINEVNAAPAAQAALPTPLTESESRILRHLVEVRDNATKDIGFFVNQSMAFRGLNPPDWSISLADYKTIMPTQKQQAPPPNNANVPPASIPATT